MTPDLKVKLVPWDDPEFVQAFERTADAMRRDGRPLIDPGGALELQRRLRAEGYPFATCECERTIEEAMVHAAHCTVRRDGGPA